MVNAFDFVIKLCGSNPWKNSFMCLVYGFVVQLVRTSACLEEQLVKAPRKEKNE